MLASSFLDTAIGIIFVFLLLSIIATTVNEIILSYLNMRGRMLLDGIKTLLNDNLKDADGLVTLLYNHGQIYGLFKGEFNPVATRWNKLPIFRDKKKVDLPSYIPSGSFANAFIGVLAAKASQDKRTAWDNAKQAATTAVSTAKTANDQAKTTLSDANSTQAQKDAARQAAGAAQAAADAAQIAANIALFAMFKEVADDLSTNNDKVGKPLQALLATASNDLTKLTASIETWYDSAMDRVSGWYKYRTQWVLFWIGLVLAVTLNADTLNIVKQISTNDTLRQSIVAAAAKAKAPEVSGQGKPQNANAGDAGGSQAGGDQAKNDAGTQTSGQQGNAVANLKNQYDEVATQIAAVKDLGIPLGWGNCAFPTGWWPFHAPDSPPNGKRDCVVNQGLIVAPGSIENREFEGWFALGGWLLTAIAVSLGAPFWFDLLNKFMVVRSTVKPQEKSQEEGSKD